MAKRPSIDEMLAICRRIDGEGGEETSTPEPVEDSASTEEVAVEETTEEEAVEEVAEEESEEPVAGAAPKATGGKLSIAEMLAAARGEKSEEKAAPKKAAPKSTAKSTVKAKASPKKVAAQKAPAKKEPEKKLDPKDRTSILAGGAKTAKQGPMSKAELALQQARAGGAAKAEKAEKTAVAAPPMPAKPEYAKAKPKPQTDETRRGIVSVLVGGMGAMVGTFLGLGFTSLAGTAGLWTLGLARFGFPNVMRQPPAQFTVGFPAEFPPGAVATKYKAQYGVWIVNSEYNGEQQIYALSSICTHLGCTPNWLEGEQKFKCPCHGSGFYKSGINFEGPAPRPLERYAIRKADDGQLEVDKSQKFQQEMGGWEDASSFYPA